MSNIRKLARKMGSITPILTLVTTALAVIPAPVSANPNLTPGVWTNITPAAAQIGASYGLNYFTQGITIDPNNPNVLYFAVAGYDANFNTRPSNIWKSTDAGSNWTALTPLDQPIHVRVDPTNSNHLYAVDGVGGSTLGFWVSTNGGSTWTQPAGFTTMCNNLSTQGFPGFNDGYSVDMDPSNPNHILYSSHGQYGIVGESFDGGTTWTSHTTPAATGSGGYSVFFLYSPNLAVGNAQTWLFCTQTANTFRTTNSGTSWTLVPTANSMNHGGNQIYYTSSGVLYAGSNSWPVSPQVTSPMKSTDNGVTWQPGGAPSGCMGIIGDGTNLYTGLWWGTSAILTSLETDGQHWTACGGSPVFNNAGPFEMAYDKVNGIVYSSNTSNGVTQTTGSGDGIWAYKVPSGTGAPSAPTGLTATPGNAQVALAWNASSGATAYDVKRSTVSGSGYATVSSPTTTNYTNTGLTNGTAYYYVVDAKNANGTSGNSSQASATPVAPPAAPTGLTATPGNAQVALAWTASSGATSYGALRSTVSGSGYASVATGIAATNYTNTGLTNGTTYYFVVTATNAGGTSGNSSQASATPQVSVPAAPTGLTATAGNTQVGLSWTASSGATSYNALRSTVSGSGYASVATGISTTSYTNTGLTNGTTYYFVVTATNAAGTSGNSNQASATPAAGGTGSIISIDFVGGTGGVPSSMGSAESAGVVAATNWNNGTGFTSTGLALNYSTGAASGASAVWTATQTWLTTITESPGNYRMMKGYLDDTPGTAATTVTVSSLPSAMTSSGYDVYVYSDDSTNHQTINYTIGSTTITAIENGSGSFSGTFIQANNSVGNYVEFTNLSSASFTLSALPASGSNRAPVNGMQIVAHSGGGIPSAPTGLTATPGNAQVALSWTASSGATSYNVLRSTVSGSGYASVATGVATTSYTNTGLTNGTTYYFVVTATNASGTSGNSNQASATPVGIPAAPTGLTATPGNTQVALSWTASSGATSYNVLRSTVSGSGYASVATGVATTSYTNTGLTNGTTYYFVVTATNSAGTSGNSNQASATPTAGSPPPAPTGLAAIAGDAQIAVSWSASTGATSYNVKRSTVSGSGYVTVSSPTTTSFTNTGLTDGTAYYYVVTAVNSNGESGNSSQVTGTPCQYNFETDAQGWTFSAAPITGVSQSATQAFGPTHSLAVTINGAPANANARFSNPPTPAGKVVTYHVWIPTGSQLSAIQPYVMDHNWLWTGTIVPLANLTQGGWNTVQVTVPANAVMPLNELGVEFRVSATWSATCYVDSISW